MSPQRKRRKLRRLHRPDTIKPRIRKAAQDIRAALLDLARRQPGREARTALEMTRKMKLAEELASVYRDISKSGKVTYEQAKRINALRKDLDLSKEFLSDTMYMLKKEGSMYLDKRRGIARKIAEAAAITAGATAAAILIKAADEAAKQQGQQEEQKPVKLCGKRIPQLKKPPPITPQERAILEQARDDAEAALNEIIDEYGESRRNQIRKYVRLIETIDKILSRPTIYDQQEPSSPPNQTRSQQTQ